MTPTPYACFLASQAPSSQIAQHSSCKSFLAEWGAVPADPHLHPWHRWKPEHMTRARAWIIAHRAPATAVRVWSVIRGTMRECYRLGLLDRERFDRLMMVKSPPRPGPSSERCPTAAEVRALFLAASEQPPILGARNAALLGLGYGCGLRRVELAQLSLADFRDDARIFVRGKGQRSRTVGLPDGTLAAVIHYLGARKAELGANWRASAALLLATDGRGSRLLTSAMSYSSIDGALAALCLRARLPRFSSHDLRRSYCSELLNAGADLSTVQRLMGHATLTTTAIYDRRGEAAQLAATGLLVVPFVTPARAGADQLASQKATTPALPAAAVDAALDAVLSEPE